MGGEKWNRSVLLVDDSGITLAPSEIRASKTCPEEHHTVFTEEYIADVSGNVAPTTVITPTSGLRVVVHIYSIFTDGGSGVIQLDFVASSIKVARHYVNKSGVAVVSRTHIFGAIDEVLTVEASGIGNGSKFFIDIGYIMHA